MQQYENCFLRTRYMHQYENCFLITRCMQQYENCTSEFKTYVAIWKLLFWVQDICSNMFIGLTVSVQYICSNCKIALLSTRYSICCNVKIELWEQGLCSNMNIKHCSLSTRYTVYETVYVRVDCSRSTYYASIWKLHFWVQDIHMQQYENCLLSEYKIYAAIWK